MHIFISYIGGGAMSPLAMIAKQAGNEVSGSDKADGSPYLALLKQQGIEDIGFGVTDEHISTAHTKHPVDWYVYSSAVEKEYPNHPEFEFCRANNIKMTKRDDLLNEILSQNELKLIAIAGTHGKTTTTAMAIWLFKQLKVNVSYSVGVKLSFGEMGKFDPESEYFIYECDEYDRNFLAFNPYLSIITGVSWDHHEIFPTQEDYNSAFVQFLGQSHHKVLLDDDAKRLNVAPDESYLVLPNEDPGHKIGLAGKYNRLDAWLVANAVHQVTKEPLAKLLDLLSNFPGVSRRFEKIVENLYTDYAHTPEKITGALNTASESISDYQKLVVVYEPLTNRRMHYTKGLHQHLFDNVDQLYWVPSYLAREDPDQPVLTSTELIDSLSDTSKAKAHPKQLNDDLKSTINTHLSAGDLVLCLSGGGTDSLDDWLRKEFK